MSNLSKETIDRIKIGAEHYANIEIGGKDKISVPYLLNQWGLTFEDYNAGALHEAGRAQDLVDALKQIEQMSDPGDYWKAICEMKSIASNALAKYKEVSND